MKAPPLSPEPLSPEPLSREPLPLESLSPEPQDRRAQKPEREAPSPLVRAEAAAPSANAEPPVAPGETAHATATSVTRAPASRQDPGGAPTAARRETGERVMRTAPCADSPCAASSGKPTPEPLRACPPGESAGAGECDVFENRSLPAGNTSPPAPSARLAASAPFSRPKAAHAEQDEREIHIHIGRIEVSALPSPPARKSPRPAAMSLDEYLSRRSGEKR